MLEKTWWRQGTSGGDQMDKVWVRDEQSGLRGHGGDGT